MNEFERLIGIEIQVAIIAYSVFADACDNFEGDRVGNLAYAELAHHRVRWYKAWRGLSECYVNHIAGLDTTV